MENSEVQVWLDFSLACKYISQEQHQDLNFKSEEIGKLLFHMITILKNIHNTKRKSVVLLIADCQLLTAD